MQRVLVSDFDGTMTRHDFYLLAIERLIPKDVPDFWSEYRAGKITHFEALRRYFAAIRVGERDVLAVVDQMELDASLSESLSELRRQGWRIVVASAGCEWYIQHLLGRAQIEIEVHANPGRWVPGEGLVMELPTKSTYFSPTLGIDKAKIVQTMIESSARVAFAGDGYPDVEPALLVPEEYRFARGHLAQVLAERGHGFQPYDRWSQIVQVLNASDA